MLFFVNEILCCSLMMIHCDGVEGKDIVVTRRPNLPPRKRLGCQPQNTVKNKKKWKKKSCTNRCSCTTNNQLHSNLLRYFSSMKQHTPWWTIMLLLPSLPCTHICQLQNHHQYCSDSSIVCKLLYRITCCCLFSSCSSFCTVMEEFRRGGNCWTDTRV